MELWLLILYSGIGLVIALAAIYLYLNSVEHRLYALARASNPDKYPSKVGTMLVAVIITTVLCMLFWPAVLIYGYLQK